MLILIARISILPCLAITLAFFSLMMVLQSLKTPELTRFSAPGEQVFTVGKSGEYTIWQVRFGTREDGSYSTEEAELPEALTLTVMRETDGTTVTLRGDRGTRTATESESQQSIVSFEVGTPGDYRVVATLPEPTTPPTTLSVSESIAFGKTFGMISVVAVVCSLLMIAGFIYGVVAIRSYLRDRVE